MGRWPRIICGWIFLILTQSELIDDTLIRYRQIIGLLGCLERFLADADERGNAFLMNVLEKQHMRLKGLFDRHVVSFSSNSILISIHLDEFCFKNEQIKGVEQTKLTSKKRKGVVHFIKYFPIYIGRVESQLIGLDGLEVRASVDTAYEKIVQTMFDSLKQMAKMDGEGEDKGQLNYHVILIGKLRISSSVFFITYDDPRKHAPLRCGDCTAGNRLGDSLFETGREYLRRESQRIRQACPQTTFLEIDCESRCPDLYVYRLI